MCRYRINEGGKVKSQSNLLDSTTWGCSCILKVPGTMAIACFFLIFSKLSYGCWCMVRHCCKRRRMRGVNELCRTWVHWLGTAADRDFRVNIRASDIPKTPYISLG